MNWRPLSLCLWFAACAEGRIAPPSATTVSDAAASAGGAAADAGEGDSSPPSRPVVQLDASAPLSVSQASADAGPAVGSAMLADTGTPSPASTLPIPPGLADHARPSGGTANLTVLSWAGFKGAASYTFDDGQPSHIEHWNEIKATKARVTFYVTTAYRDSEPGFDTTWRDVAASGSEVGNHTVDHCYYSGASCGVNGKTILSPKGRELDDASSYIVQTTGQPDVWTAATPFGDSAWSVETVSRFMLTRGTIAGVAGDGMIGPNDSNDAQNLPTRIAQMGDAAPVFSKYLDEARSAGKWAILLFHSISPTNFAWFATVDIHSITDSIAHGQQLGDVWIDSVVNVGSYWLAQRLFAGLTPSSTGSQQRWQWQLPAHFPKRQFLRVKVDGGTLRQNDQPLTWDAHGYYEVSLDVGSLTWSP